MSEGTHSPAPKKRFSFRLWGPIVAGTLVVVITTAMAIQFWHGEKAEAQTGQPGVAKVGGTNTQSRPLARVNNQYITYDQVAQECFSRLGEEVLDNIINRTIIQQAVHAKGITITEQEVHNEVLRIAKDVNLPVDTWYQMLAAERNVTPEQYRRDIIWPKIALEKLAGTDVNVTQEDLQKAFVRDFGPRVRCRMIMMDNFRRANEVWQQATANPGEFERLARQYSVEPNSRALGGAFPPIRRHAGNEQLENAAFRLRPGEVSGLVQIGVNQYVILFCEGHTDPVVSDVNEVRDELYGQIVKDKTQEKVAKVFDQIKEASRIDNYLTNKSMGGAAQGGPIQQTSGTKSTGGVQQAGGSGTR